MTLKKYISGFDYLRAFFSILVVIWHTKSIPEIMAMPPDIQNILKVFYYNVCCLAVPIFFQISLFLFYQKQATDRSYFLRKKLPDLLIVYGIWMLIGLVINSLVSKGEYLLELSTVQGIVLFVIAGSRPELYFLFSLTFITVLAFLNHKFLIDRKNSIYIQSMLLCVSLIVIICLDVMAIITDKDIFSAVWNPICFIPYIFSSSILIVLDRDNQSKLSTYFYNRRFLFISILFTIFLLLSSLEWHLTSFPAIQNDAELLPMYARVSLVFGAFITCYCVILHKGKPSNLIREISQESLGIYVMHRYMLQFIQYLNYSVGFVLNPVVGIVFAVTIPMLISKLLKKYQIGRVMLNATYKPR
jgi:surface polysaccharide O-acyltransferase-like enzyme